MPAVVDVTKAHWPGRGKEKPESLRRRVQYSSRSYPETRGGKKKN